MTRYLAPIAAVFALATTAHAQSYVTQSYTTTDAYGNSTTTTVQAPSSAVGLIANQAFNNGGYVNGGAYINGGFSNGGFSIQYGGSSPVYYGNYPYGGYAGYAGYGYNPGYYGNYPVYQSCPPPCPPTYVFPPTQTYVRPAPNTGPRTYLPGQYNPPLPKGTLYGSMAITPTPQLNGTPPVTVNPSYNYGWRDHDRSDNDRRNRGRNR